MEQIISFIRNNTKWIFEMAINICMVVGYAGFIVMSSQQIKFQARQNKPQIDIRIEINNQNQPRLEVHNLGDLDTEGVAYILVEPVLQEDTNFFESEIIPNYDYKLLTDQEKFNQYCFGKLDFKLGSSEDPYIYDPCPVMEYLEELTGRKRIPHIIRIEGNYQAVKYNDQQFKFTRNYKLIPQDDSWLKGQISLNTVFATEAETTKELDYENYKADLND